MWRTHDATGALADRRFLKFDQLTWSIGTYADVCSDVQIFKTPIGSVNGAKECNLHHTLIAYRLQVSAGKQH